MSWLNLIQNESILDSNLYSKLHSTLDEMLKVKMHHMVVIVNHNNREVLTIYTFSSDKILNSIISYITLNCIDLEIEKIVKVSKDSYEIYFTGY